MPSSANVSRMHRIGDCIARTFLFVIFCCLSTAAFSQTINTVAGNGTVGYSGDGGPATAATLGVSPGVWATGGYYYIADVTNHVIRMIDPSGVITTIAGTGTAGYSGDGGPATAATLNNPNCVIADGMGNVYIADGGNHCIRSIDASGNIYTIAGNGLSGYTGDGGDATAAQLNFPAGIIEDLYGNIYIADNGNNCIRMISASNSSISTIAGTGTAGGSGDGGAATAALLSGPYGLALDGANNLYISDAGNYCVRMIDGSGVINTVAGTNGTAGNGGDGGAATAAGLQNPLSLAYDFANDNLLIADAGDNKIRVVDVSGVINTYAGTGTAGYSGDGGAATAAELNQAAGIAVDNNGTIIIGDSYNGALRSIGAAYSITGAITVCVGQSITLSSTSGSGTWRVTPSASASLSTTTGTSTVLTGLIPGVVTVSCTTSTGVSTYRVTVNALPVVTIAGGSVQAYCPPMQLIATRSGLYRYAWTPAGAGLSSTTIYNPTVTLTVTTTYTVTVRHMFTGCTNSATVMVKIPTCSFCPASGATISLGGGGVIAGGTTYGTSAGAPTHIYIDDGIPGPSDIFINGNTIFLNAVVMVAAQKRLVVQAGVNVTLDNSHFMVCSNSQIWTGFRLNFATTGAYIGQATFTAQNNSLIEDADIAVQVLNANTAAAANIISLDETIFNRCKVSVWITNFPVSLATYPFLFGSLAFIVRDVSGYYSSTTGRYYPDAWPTVTDLTAVTWSSGTNVRTSMNIDNPSGKPTGPSTFGAYTRAGVLLKSGVGAFAGIRLENFGQTTAGPVYSGFSYPSSSNYSMLFDNMLFGIHMIGSNSSISSCTFTYIQRLVGSTGTADGTAIFAQNGASMVPSTSLQRSLSVDGTSANNNFYSCYWGVYAEHMQRVTVDGNNFFSDHTTSDPITTFNGNMAVNLKFPASGLNHDGVSVSNNYMANMVYAINYYSDDDNIAYGIDMNNNQITGASSTWSGYTLSGISLFNLSSAGTGPTGATNVLGNTMASVYNGVFATGFQQRFAHTDNNIIGLVPDVVNPAGTPQFGIQQSSCLNNSADGNYVWYALSPLMTIPATGISSQNNSGNSANCNYVDGFFRAFDFTQGSTATWLRNVMANTHPVGGYIGSADFYLSGLIGQQPASGASASDNQFSSTAGYINTYVNAGTSALANKLYVRSTAMPWKPNVNRGLGLPLYGFPGTLPLSSATTICAPAATSQPSTLGRGAEEGEAADSSASDSMIPCPRVNWMMQMAQWESYNRDTNYADSGIYTAEAWRRFGAMATSHSRYKWLTDIAAYLNDHNHASALSLISAGIHAYADSSSDSASGVAMADASGADEVVSNYLSYYTIYAHYLRDSSLSGDDSTALHRLAYGCVNKDGAILIKARTLNSMLYSDYTRFADICTPCQVYSRRNGKAIETGVSQGYSLYPNPANGMLNIERNLTTGGAVEAEVYSAIGRLMLRTTLDFTGAIERLQLGEVPSGIYLLKLKDAEGKEYHFKFVVE